MKKKMVCTSPCMGFRHARVSQTSIPQQRHLCDMFTCTYPTPVLDATLAPALASLGALNDPYFIPQILSMLEKFKFGACGGRKKTEEVSNLY